MNMPDLSTKTKYSADKFDLSIIIVNFHTEELTLDCIDSVIKNTRGIKYEIILVDSETTGKIKISKNFKLIKSKTNLGFTGGNNLGMKDAKGKYILLLNSDTLIHDNVLGEMVLWMNGNPKIGISTCALKNKNGSLQTTGGYFPTLLRVFSWMIIQDLPFVDNFIKPFHPKINFYNGEKELDWVTGAFLLTRKEIVDEVGSLDEKYFMYVEDVDFCYRVKQKGFQIIYNPKWSITHFGGASSVKAFPLISEMKNIKKFYEKFYPSWQQLPLKILLKLGCLWRLFLISPKIYAKAFIEI